MAGLDANHWTLIRAMAGGPLSSDHVLVRWDGNIEIRRALAELCKRGFAKRQGTAGEYWWQLTDEGYEMRRRLGSRSALEMARGCRKSRG